MVYAVIVAAGKGVRMNSGIPKQYLKLGGTSLLSFTIGAFDKCVAVDEIILVLPPEDIGFRLEKIITPASFKKKITPVAGGPTRQDSVYNGLAAVPDDESIVLIHDGVRPFISTSAIEECVSEAALSGACIAALPASDTLKLADGSEHVEKTLERSSVWLAQTPQAFRCSIIKKAHERARNDGFHGTDDASLVERIGVKVKLVRGSVMNIKVTTPGDLETAKAFLRSGCFS
jgi:2-C-methyl-D-erythritol 4-phosphate cytidylyltransferase